MDRKFNMESTLEELMAEPKAVEFLNKVMSEIALGPALNFIKGMKLKDLAAYMDDAQKKIIDAVLDIANGREVDFDISEIRKMPPRINVRGEITYNIDDVDGQLCMLDRNFSGCLVLRFTKKMDESVYGRVTCEGKVLSKAFIKSASFGGDHKMQFLGIPVRDVFTEYGKEYVLHVEGFVDVYGVEMQPQDIVVRTLPKSQPDPAYKEHDEVALRAAREGIVLLKNEGGVLPLAPDSGINLIGARLFRTGTVGAGWINPRYNINLIRGIEEYSQFKLIEDADTAIVVISRMSAENVDNRPAKGDFYLTDEEENLIRETTEKHARTIVILNTGYPIDVRFAWKYKVDALIWCGYPGMLGGRALVEILDGRVNPSGKLPDTWSLDYYDIPASANFHNATNDEEASPPDPPFYVNTVYEEDIYVGYRYFETFNKPVAFPFGYGLSYTTFRIEARAEGLHIKAVVTNTGKVSGAEVVQVYAKIPDGKLEQPSKRLVGFAKTRQLAPGESQELVFDILKEDLASYDAETACWIMEKGKYELYVGNSVKDVEKCGEVVLEEDEVIKRVKNRMVPPVKIDVLSKKNPQFPKGLYSGIKKGITELDPKGVREHFEETEDVDDIVSRMSVEELARLSVCAARGARGEAGRIYKLDKYGIPDFLVADGNNSVNISKPNIGMPCSCVVCATFNRDIAYDVGRVIAEEAKENGIHLILAPAMNIHRNPLNGRHAEYFSEDPYLAGTMAGYQSKGLEDNGVSSCLKHVVCNNCEFARMRNHSILTERALREIYLKAFEIAMRVNKPDSIMTSYNACNGVFTAEDEELIQGIFREEFGFEGFVMTDWGSYATADMITAVQAGNCWMTPGSTDDTYVKPIIQGVKDGRIDIKRLRSNVRHILRVVQKRTEADLGVK